MNVSQQIASLIPVKHCFLLPGGGNAPLVEAFADKAVCCLHEHTCVVAAEAYSQLTGLGCALVTTGPGVTNAMTGLAAAYLDSTPLILLSGNVKQEYSAGTGCLRQRGFQELPNLRLTQSVTKNHLLNGYLDDTRYISARVKTALSVALTPRCGPAHLDIPLDIQVAKAVEDNREPCGPDVTTYCQAAAEHCAELLRKAERPVLLIGHGARGPELTQLLEALDLPTMLTWRAADILAESDPLFCGRPGIAGQRGANLVQQSCDLLICIGARLDIGQTGYDISLFAPQATKFVVDVDTCELHKHAGNTTFRCDGYKFLQLLVGERHKWGWLDDTWRDWCKEMHTKYRPHSAFFDALSSAMEPTDIIVCGSSGTAAESSLQHLAFKAGQRLVFSPGLGSMGFGLPAAIGAATATGRRVICIEGDGSFAMNAYELETVQRLGLLIKIFVLDNGGYASIVRSQQRAGFQAVVPSVPKPELFESLLSYQRFRYRITAPSQVNSVLCDGRVAVAPVLIDCSLSHRMVTIPPSKPQAMVPVREDAEAELKRWQ
jgi:acetolactate synthase-1/2/3 large subunit